MKKEIDKAVETFHRIAFGTRKNGNPVITEGKLASFVAILTELLVARYKNNWYPQSPDRGSGYRCLRINSQCTDPTIVTSLKRAKIEKTETMLLTELTIWVDPGVVSVRIGEEGSIGSEVVDEEVYRRGLPPGSPDRLSVSSDEAYSSSCSPTPPPAMDRSTSISPTLKTSPSNQNHATSMDYNPYSPPSQVSYPHRFQHQGSPSGKGVTPSYQVNQPNAGLMAASKTQLPSVLASSQETFLPGHIPSQSSYTCPRALFPHQDNGGSFHQGQFRERMVNSNFTRQALSMHMTNGMMPGSYLDIPAMA